MRALVYCVKFARRSPLFPFLKMHCACALVYCVKFARRSLKLLPTFLGNAATEGMRDSRADEKRWEKAPQVNTRHHPNTARLQISALDLRWRLELIAQLAFQPEPCIVKNRIGEYDAKLVGFPGVFAVKARVFGLFALHLPVFIR